MAKVINNVYVNGENIEAEIEEDMGASVLSLDEAEALANKILDCCQEIIDSQPDPPLVTVTWKQFLDKDYPKNTNLNVLNERGQDVGRRVTCVFKRIVR